MSSPTITVRVELELERALKAQADEQKVSLSEYVRVLLRQGAGVCDLRESGYREGKMLAYAETRSRLDGAMNGVPATLDALERNGGR